MIRRYAEPQHQPEAYTAPGRIARCSCLAVFRTRTELLAHCEHPEVEPEPVVVAPEPESRERGRYWHPQLGEYMTPAGKHAAEGKPHHWHPWWAEVA